MADIVLTGADDRYYSIGDRWQTTTGYILMFMADGDLQLFNVRSVKLWSTATGSRGAIRLRMQADGNLVLYDILHRAIWASDTSGHPGASLSIQDDGNVVIYSSDRKPVWSTGTAGQ